MAKEHGSFAETTLVLTELIPQDICNKSEEQIELLYVKRSIELQKEIQKAVKKIYGKHTHLASGLKIEAAKDEEIKAFKELTEEKPHPGKGKGHDKKEK